MINNDTALYIHIPFCIKKCAYCDFLSFPRFDMQDSYKSALIAEIQNFKTDKPVSSVFIGGGTPSCINAEDIADILACIRQNFDLAQNCEISMEANPGTVDEKKLEIYAKSGINRLSMGVQSFDNALLKLLGRIHTAEEAADSFRLARQYFDNINLDLMFALPRQTPEQWAETLETAVSLAPEHISAYSLIIEEGTPFYDMYRPVDEVLDRQMYHFAVDFLSKHGYNQYEISNFARSGRECRHNLRYWRGGDYKGLGLGAASLSDNKRLKNTEVLDEYLNGVTVTENISLDKADIMGEFMFLGLRCTCGISAKEFKARFCEDIYDVYGDILNKHRQNGLLEINGDNIRLTKRGIDISNMVFVDFVT